MDSPRYERREEVPDAKGRKEPRHIFDLGRGLKIRLRFAYEDSSHFGKALIWTDRGGTCQPLGSFQTINLRPALFFKDPFTQPRRYTKEGTVGWAFDFSHAMSAEFRIRFVASSSVWKVIVAAPGMPEGYHIETVRMPDGFYTRGLTRVISVPYFMQPTSKTCQSTVLKMFASYLEQKVVLQSTGAAEREIGDIWKDINEDPARPVLEKNAHRNMQWWLERHFPSLRFPYNSITDEGEALQSVVKFIDSGFPVLTSVSHSRSPGHIILVVGYEDYVLGTSSLDLQLVVHDPNGAFDPSLRSTLFSNMIGGQSLPSGGEAGPGKAVRLPITGISRRRTDDAKGGTYYLLSASR